MDTDIGTELFASYENDLNLIIADISSNVQAAQDQEGEPRNATLRAAQRAVEEAEEIVRTFPEELTFLADRPDGDGADEYTQCSTS
jgi:hypothetical protein